MQHLLNSVVAIERLELSTLDGRATMTWLAQPFPLNYVRCRLDLTFIRRGKDQPLPIEAGKAPDRVGVMFCSADAPLRAGDRLRSIENDVGIVAVPGVFEIRTVPDLAQNYAGAHHIEVQIVEVSQAIADSILPAAWS